MEQAINKVRHEMDANRNHSYIQVVGRFLLDYIQAHPKEAQKVCNPQKTISKSLNEMKKAAEKNKVGNCAVLTDQEGFDVVLKYFGIDSKFAGTLHTGSIVASAPANETFDIKLEDLL